MSEISITFEECACRILERELGTSVVLYDDGSEPSMYDLRIGSVDAPTLAVECTAAVDAMRTETWSIGPAKGSLAFTLKHDWYVVLRPHTRVRKLRRRIEQVLQDCELAGTSGYTSVGPYLKRDHQAIFEALEELQIDSVHSSSEPGTAAVHLGMTGFGGAVDPTGRAVATWIGDFLRHHSRHGIISKLQDSPAVDCHVFVGVSFGDVPWEVESYLGTRTELLPPKAPDLPGSVRGVWIMYGRRGVHWDCCRRGCGCTSMNLLVGHPEI